MKSLLQNKTFWLLALLCALTLLPFIGLFDYHTKGEPRESIVAMTMLTDGNWILPRNSYGEIAYKPPFFHWCIAAVWAVWGEMTEAGSRLPSAGALILTTLATFAFYARRRDTRLALIAALVGYTSFELHRAGANCRVDMVLTALIVMALYGLCRWHERGMRGLPRAPIAAMALATMTKGPVGSVLPCLVAGVFLLLRGRDFWRVLLTMAAVGVLSLVPYAAWFAVAWQNGGQEFADLVYEENIGRMTGTMSYKVHVMPWTYNFVTLAAGYVPWTLLLLIGLCATRYGRMGRQARRWWNDTAGSRLHCAWTAVRQRIARTDDADLFSLTAIVVMFVFYCIPESKRSVYLMPVYPFIGYFAARWLLRTADARPRLLRIYGTALSVLSLLLFAAFIAVKLHAVPESIFGSGRHAADNIAMLHALENTGGPVRWLLVLVPVAAALWWWRARKATGHWLVCTVTAIILSLYVAIDGVYTPTVLNSKSVKTIAAELDRVAPESEGRMYEFMEVSLEVKGDPLHFFEINYYLHDRIGSFYHERPESGFLLTTAYDAEARFAEFEREGYSFEMVYRAPKRGMELYRFTRTKDTQTPDDRQ